jgi:lysophospholipase L1-like esterase
MTAVLLRRPARRAALGAGVLGLSLTGLLAPAASASTLVLGAPRADAAYVATWTASPQPPTPPSLAGPTDFSARGFRDQTVRQVVHTSVGGTQVLLRFSNAFGTRSVGLTEVTVGLPAGGGRVVPGSLHRVTFSGRGSASIPRGAELYSDPVPMAVGAESDLAVSTYLRAATGPATYHSLGEQTTFVAPGDRAAQTGWSGGSTSSSFYFLDGVDVTGPARASVVAVGDSITDGYGSTPDADNRWPNYLSQRLNAQPGNALSVVDQGISGNRVLHDSPCFGTNLLSRLDRDVLAQDGATTVILLEGINDIGFSQTPNTGCTAPNTAVSAQQITAGYEQVVRRAHLKGLRVLGGTLTPFQGAAYWSPAEAKRQAVNTYIRTSGTFDGVVDFAAALADPEHPRQMLPAYDSGDHLHPNDAGYARMAAAVDLTLLRR